MCKLLEQTLVKATLSCVFNWIVTAVSKLLLSRSSWGTSIVMETTMPQVIVFGFENL